MTERKEVIKPEVTEENEVENVELETSEEEPFKNCFTCDCDDDDDFDYQHIRHS